MATTSLASGCASGRLEWATGADDLRTALYCETDVGSPRRTTLILSNGQFDCVLPTPASLGNDPTAVEEALFDISWAACREDARHVVLDLYGTPGESVVGRYTGDIDAEWGLPEVPTRLTRGIYVGIDEVATNGTDDLTPEGGEIITVARTGRVEIGEGGEVEVTGEGNDRLTGRFGFPGGWVGGQYQETHVSGRFVAEACPMVGPDGEDTMCSQRDLLWTTDPTLICP